MNESEVLKLVVLEHENAWRSRGYFVLGANKTNFPLQRKEALAQLRKTMFICNSKSIDFLGFLLAKTYLFTLKL